MKYAPPSKTAAASTSYYASGANRPADIRGFDAVGQAIGVAAKTCEHCGEDWIATVADVYTPERTFALDACCEETYSILLEDLREADPRDAARWFYEQTGIKVRQLFCGGLHAACRYSNGGMTLDYGLELRPVDFATAREFVRQHHRHNKPPRGWRFGFAVYNGPELVAVAMVGRPVARMLQQAHPDWCEVTRVCVDPDVPSAIAWNACSMLYGAAAKEARRRGFARIITYIREDERGDTVRAAGWSSTNKSKKERTGWNRPSRKRTASAAEQCRKIRYERGLTKPAKRAVRAATSAFNAQLSLFAA